MEKTETQPSLEPWLMGPAANYLAGRNNGSLRIAPPSWIYLRSTVLSLWLYRAPQRSTIQPVTSFHLGPWTAEYSRTSEGSPVLLAGCNVLDGRA